LGQPVGDDLGFRDARSIESLEAMSIGGISIQQNQQVTPKTLAIAIRKMRAGSGWVSKDLWG